MKKIKLDDFEKEIEENAENFVKASKKTRQRVKKIMPPDGKVHTPYGATESLPISSMTGSEIIKETWPETRKGQR